MHYRTHRRPPSVRVLVAYVRAGSYQGAADLLGIKVSTVKATLAALRQEYGARSTPHLAALIYRERGDVFHE